MTSRMGYSLIEMMITMTILVIVAIFMLETFTVNNRNYIALDQTMEA